mgnify:CR=1 FL=1
MEKSSKDVKDILKDPSAFYSSPQLVADDPSLTQEQKRVILRCWEDDEKAKQRAASENMPPPPSNTETTGDTLALISKLRGDLGQNEAL